MTKEALEVAVKAMQEGALYDVTIVCTTDDHQADYWMDQLAKGVCRSKSGSSDSPYPMVLAVSEDWGGSGAGNGLGTLYAYQKSVALAQEKYHVDLSAALNKKEISVALYHTAGKGTRMAPLPASENNNKPGVVSKICVLYDARPSCPRFSKIICARISSIRSTLVETPVWLEGW